MTEEIFKGIKEQLAPTRPAEKLLKNPELVPKILEEISKFAVGEYLAQLTLLLSFSQVWVNNPFTKIHLLINAESSTGKSYLLKKVSKIFPHEQVKYWTRVTPRTLDYWPPKKMIEEGFTWDHKILLLEDVEQEVLDSSSIKVWMSEGQKTLLLLNNIVRERSSNGTPNIAMTFAGATPKTELLSRCLLIKLDESQEQTQSIISHLARKFGGETEDEYDNVILRALELLKPYPVVIPYWQKLEFLFPTKNVRIRRYFSLFCELIKCSTALHQNQRKKTDKGILAEGQDYDYARYIIRSIFQSENLEPLTHKLKKAFDCCIKMSKEYDDGWFLAKNIIAEHPKISQKSWYIYLGELGEKGFLDMEIDQDADSTRKPMKYKAKPFGEFDIPNFTNLQ